MGVLLMADAAYPRLSGSNSVPAIGPEIGPEIDNDNGSGDRGPANATGKTFAEGQRYYRLAMKEMIITSPATWMPPPPKKKWIRHYLLGEEAIICTRSYRPVVMARRVIGGRGAGRWWLDTRGSFHPPRTFAPLY
jgi:hypothetical protein